MSISAAPTLYDSAGDTDRRGCWHPARRQSRGKVGRIQFRAMSFMFGCGNHSPPAARFQGNSARQWSSPCVSHRLNTALTFRRKFELPAPQRCRIQVGVRWRNHVAAEVPTRVEGMYKGCTRDVQGMYKGCTRDQHARNTGAIPGQYLGTSRGSRWSQGPHNGLPPDLQRAKEKSRACDFDLWAIACSQIGWLKLEVPPFQSVYLAGEAGDLVGGNGVQRRAGIPCLAQGGLDRLVGEAEVDEEFGVGAVAAIGWLAGGLGQNFREQPEIEVQQEGAVE